MLERAAGFLATLGQVEPGTDTLALLEGPQVSLEFLKPSIGFPFGLVMVLALILNLWLVLDCLVLHVISLPF